MALVVIATQTTLIVGWFLLWLVFSQHVSYDDVSAVNAQRRVAQSIRVGASGNLRIVPSEPLMAYGRGRPKFMYAAYVQGRLLEGSSPALAKAVSGRGPALPLPKGRIWLANGKLGYSDLYEIRGGGDFGAVVVTTGNRFGIDDVPTLLAELLSHAAKQLGPAIAVSIVAIPFAIRRALAPLRQAAAKAAKIRIETLDQRLSSTAVPPEIHPFVSAINQLLERLEREVGLVQVLVGNAAHELRTPVAILCARLDSLPYDQTTRELRSDAQRLSLMVDQLLAASCIHTQSSSLSRQVELVALLRELIADMAPLAGRGSRMLALEVDAPRVEVFGQPDGLRSAIANLIDNAIRAEPLGGTVLVTLAMDEAMANICVIDHGSGVDPADQEQVFEPFWRRDNHWKGTGLGLAIARRIAEVHAGTITVTETLGGGATFRLSVARHAPAVG
ncbi:sensor histidine kinase [Lysobacter auxotrophicus]|uniref:histidine kinase n=1 Tax=Lysobacter auxotrophicus TaxID=2992573 RepID=A0ABN6UQB6_9GAMM|nr:HAMP domain-containing sensor histidine kinase [Lysobacter auxotrophicus]BDU18117.1 HAMP domain-containing histidine kinase [Lysobacter auxotrophicus]